VRLIIISYKRSTTENTPIAETDVKEFDRIMHSKVRGNLLCVCAQVAAMRKQELQLWSSRIGKHEIGRGVMVNLASHNLSVDLIGKGSYTILKHTSMEITKMAG
jgi:hypothetical protein